ncbi:ricin-type beta-trefoil lectin domain protein [Amycolatopsis carbonis]|uniref:Ricin-type beta-trefoil lectin domain protein n=1 Tax=Amycolatopsis carbonis TaxID=715471 RepID=A0A9Y2IM70_9PSEU|nr:ricin-type beta-trefoil lectin domain protein [Amycolatopsis sp. 2-15]WIX81919.1 ricin-type beta-trefoil lectin domain protein [Amycolatopsis sp. 2-15]
MRISKLRTLAAAALPVLAGVAMATVSPAVSEAAPAAGAAFPAHYSAPYLQVSDGDIGQMAADMNATGTKFYTLAFLTPSGGCNQLWEANGTGVGSFKSQISSLQAAGGNVIPSFGGAAGGEIAQTCTNTSSLTAAYANVVNTYGTPRLDFDIEEDTIKDTAANQRRNSALAALQQQNPSVQVDYTLAVDPSGLGSTQMDILRDAKNKGLDVSVVNLMVMDFYDGQPVLDDALASARTAAGQLASLYGISTSAAYAKMGLTPIAGRNDDGAQFSQSDAQQLETFAAQNGVQELSFWEVQDYDRATGYAYSRIFNAITGGGGGTTPPPTGGKQITGYGGKCVDVAGANPANGTKVDLYTCNGTNAQQWTSTGGTLQALGKCMDVASAGTNDGAKVQVYDCNGTAAQQWTRSGNQLVNTGSGKCLDATGPSSADGTQLQIWTCTGASNQSWSL